MRCRALLAINKKVNVCISGSVTFSFTDEAEERGGVGTVKQAARAFYTVGRLRSKWK